MNEQLIAFLDKYGLEGRYSGGGDSGGIDEFDTEDAVEEGETIDIDMNNLQNWVYENTLSEYQGWDGNWSASGSITYDKETRQIEVTGSEEDEDNQELEKTLEILLAPFFTAEELKRVSYVHISMDARNDSEPEIRIHIENGPWTESLEKVEQAILKYVTNLVEEYDNDDGDRYNLSGQFKPTEPVKLEIYRLAEINKQWSIDLNETEFITDNTYEEQWETITL